MSDGPPRATPSPALAIYRWLLRWIPALDDEDRAGMEQVFADQHADVRVRRGQIGLFLLWMSTIHDLVRTSIAGWMEGDGAGHARVGNGVERRTRGGGLMEDWGRDVVHGIRRLMHDRGFAGAALVILALGIGANTTVFTLVNALFVQAPPGVVTPDRLVRLNRTTNGSGYGALAYPDYEYYRDANDVFDGVMAYDPDGVALTISSTDAVVGGRGWLVSNDYFDVLGARPALGRWFTPDEDRSSAAASVAVISHGLWASMFGRGSSTVGSTLTLNGNPFTIVGVAPQGFRGASPLESPPDVWVPIHAQPILTPLAGDFAIRRVPGNTWVWLWSVARLRDDVGVEAAQARMDGLAAYLEQNYAEWNEGWGVVLTPSYRFHPPDGTSLATMTRLLAAVVGLVLLIASANVAILLLARGSARARDMAVRAALGASRARLIRAMLSESLVLSVVGGIAGVAMSFWTAGAVARLMPVAFSVPFGPDWRVVLFAMSTAVITTALFGLVPAWQASRVDVHVTLKSADHAPAGIRLRNLLVVAQVALSLVLVTSAGLLARSLSTARGIDLGFETRDRVLVSVNLSNHGYSGDEGRAFVRRVLDELRRTPGIHSAATSRMIPFRGAWTTTVRPPLPGAEAIEVGLNTVSPGYFATMGIPIVRGRGFDDQDDETLGYRPAVVNRRLAEVLWPGEDPIGRRFGEEDDRAGWTVVGVAENAALYELGETPPPHAYLSEYADYAAGVVFIVDTGGASDSAARTREAIRQVDPTVAFTATRTMEDVVDTVIGRYRVAATAVGIFGLLALGLASVGLYGVLSYMVARRSREIGIRVALGASSRRVGGAVVRDGLRLTFVGTVLGLAGAIAGTRVLTSFLYGVSPRDPLTLIAGPLILVAVATGASFLPAWRATRVHPVEALKVD